MKLKEGIEVELKEKFTPELKKEVVAFANTNDGTIYIGITDKGDVIGVKSLDETMLQAGNSIRNAIKPDITPFIKIQNEEIKNKDIIKIEVQRGTSRPYYIAEKGLKPSGVYVRQGSSSVPASNEMIRQMIKETDGDSYEELRSLNQNLTFDYVEEIMKKENLQFGLSQKKTLGIIGDDSLYTNLGLLLSEQCTHTIKVAIFEGTEKTIFKDRREFSGSILKQLSDVFDFIDLSNRTNATFQGLIRKDKRDYPVQAIREALLNTVIHREYSFSASTLINIYTDRIEFVSLGGLVPGLSIEAIMLGVSQSRNEKLANFFYRLRLIEAYGTGIKKIISAYENTELTPEIIAVDGAFQVVLPNVNVISEVLTIPQFDSVNKTLGKQELEIVELLRKNGNMSRKEIQDFLNIKQSRTIILLRILLEQGVIIKVGQGKNIRYSIEK